jgi:NhaP-type Na+/H+ or K+/H+ antiporter
MSEVDPIDYVHLFVIWFFEVLLRGAVIFGSRPILRALSADGQPVTMADAAVMTWGGLRGAVGLCLSMMVSHERAGGHLDHKNASRVLFYTGGLAALTLTINAATCPMLVTWLGITQTRAAKRKLLLGMHKHMHCIVDEMAGKKRFKRDANPQEIVGPHQGWYR